MTKTTKTQITVTKPVTVQALHAVNPAITSEVAGHDRLRVLQQVIDTQSPQAAEFARLQNAAKLLQEAQHEATAISNAMADLRTGDFEREVATFEILRVTQQNVHDESPIAAHWVEYVKHGETVKLSLSSAERPLMAAVVRSGKMPVRMLALAVTAEAALERWVTGSRRGFLAG
jgi:DNA repair ATPase RecN